MDRPGKLIFILRHGQRGDVVHPEFRNPSYSPLDPSLTDLGTLQASRSQKLIECLSKSSGPYTVITSPFWGCIQTAQEIQGDFSVDWRFADFLHILNYPMDITEQIMVNSPNFLESHAKIDVKGTPPEYPEEYQKMKNRVREGFFEALEGLSTDVLVIVTHLMPLEVISVEIKGEDVKLTDNGYCCVSVGNWNNGKLESFIIADHTHAPQYIRK